MATKKRVPALVDESAEERSWIRPSFFKEFCREATPAYLMTFSCEHKWLLLADEQ